MDPNAPYAHRLVLPLSARTIAAHGRKHHSGRVDGAVGWGGERGLGEGEVGTQPVTGRGTDRETSKDRRQGEAMGRGDERETSEGVSEEWERIRERREKRYSR